MAHYTQKAILNTFEEMLEEKPFDKITVSAIVSKCEISTNTFYYHYRDIYDLLDSWLQKWQDRLVERHDPTDSWQETLKKVLHLLQDHSKIVYHLFNSISRERLERYIFDHAENTFYLFVKSEAGDAELQEETLRGIAGFCCYSLLGFFIKFIWNHMSADVDSAVDDLGQIFDGTIEYVIEKERKRGENPDGTK